MNNLRRFKIRPKLWLLLLLVMLSVVTLSRSAQAAPDGERLRNLAGDFLVGYASRSGFLNMSDSAVYQETARTEFNILTPENDMKWETIHPSQNSYNFGPAEQHVQFAQANNMAVHGHTLIWHSQNPGWLDNGNWTESQLIGVMNDHIDTVAGHFAGDVLVWDVVNEAFNEDGTYRSSVWYDTIGQEFIDLAFQRARAADPNAKLIYNDYNIGWLNSKSDAVYNMAVSMLNRGIPIDGVGFQMHLTAGGVSASSLASNIQRFAALGLDVYITELDVRIPANPSAQDLQNQANIYSTVTDVCLNQSACKALQVWGIPDKYSWVPDVFPGTGAPLLFDDNYNAKPAYYAVQTALAAHNPLPTATPGGPTATPTLPPTQTPVPPTATPLPGGSCVVTWSPLNQWGNVFQAEITIRNNTNMAVSGWALNFTHAPGQTATGGWNATISQSGNVVTASNAASHWNGTIGANGGSVTFGLQGTFTGSVVIPTDFTVNGTACNEGNPSPTATAVPPTVTATSLPPTATSIPPTVTILPPTATSTSVPPTATAVPPTATPGTGSGCTVDYVIQNDWGSGFIANVTIGVDTAVSGWTLEFDFPGNQTIVNLWGGVYTQSGNAIDVDNESWNDSIPADGSTSFGFQANFSGSNATPATFILNGIPCN